MFATSSCPAVNFSVPDVCMIPTPAGPIPSFFVDSAVSATHIPVVLNTALQCTPAHNLLTSGTISNGDEAGAAMGVASGTIIGPDRYLLGSFKTFMGVAPAARMTGMTIQNTTNMVGVTLSPSQVKLMLLG